jgi:hypothetical protein
VNLLSHVCHTYEARYCVASTTDPQLAAAMVRAVLELREAER